MSLKTIAWDITEHLGSEEDVAAYLDAVFEAGNPDEIRDALGHAARARGMTDLAQSTGMSRSGLYKALGVRLSVSPARKHFPA